MYVCGEYVKIHAFVSTTAERLTAVADGLSLSPYEHESWKAKTPTMPLASETVYNPLYARHPYVE